MAHFASREGGRWRGRWVDPGLGRGMSVLESLILYSIPGKQRKMSTPRAKSLENTKREKEKSERTGLPPRWLIVSSFASSDE